MVKKIRKTEQYAALNGKVFDNLTLDSATDSPSINAVRNEFNNVRNSLHHHNLLVNGDFLINQRGQSSYDSNASSRTYTVDMWFVSKMNHLNITVNDGYITFTNNDDTTSGAFAQFAGMNSAKNYTCIVKFKDEEPYITYKNPNKDTRNHIKDSCYIGLINASGIVGVYVNAGYNVDIEYIALYEGSIAYPHVKEDYATALDRCRNWLLQLPENICGYLGSSETKFYFTVEGLNKMVEIPTINGFDKIYVKHNGSQYTYTIDSMIPTISISQIVTVISGNELVNQSVNGYFNGSKIYVSCEPL